MNSPIVVLADKFAVGWEGDLRELTLATSAPPLHSVLELGAALRTTYTTDAHFACYHLRGPDGVEEEIPRLNKRRPDKLAAGLTELHARLLFGVVAVDVDAPKALDPTQLPGWRQQQRQALDALAWCDNATRYDTKGGYRLIWILEEPLESRAFEQLGHALRVELRGRDIPADEATADWTRLYRLPRVPRYADLAGRAFGPEDLERFDVLEWTQPAAGAPSTLPSAFRGLAAAPTQIKLTGASIPEGQRHTTLVRLGGAMRSRGFPASAIYEALLVTAQETFEGEIDEGEIRRIADWYEGVEGPNLAAIQQTEVAKASAPRIWTSSNSAVLPAAQDASKEIGPRFEHGSEVEFSGAILAQLEGSGERLRHDAGRMFGYDAPRGVWTAVSDDIGWSAVRQLDRELVPDKVTAVNPAGLKRLKVSQALCEHVWTMAQSMRASPDFFDAAPPGVAFKNGFADLGRGLLPHSPEHRTRHALDFDLDPDAECPRWMAALSSWLAPLEHDAAATADLLAEWIGAALFGIATRYERALLLLGSVANNGKSQFVDVVSALFPASALGSTPPQLMDDPNSRAELFDVRLNVVSEMPADEILRSEGFKSYITGDRVRARAVYQEGFTYRPRAGHLFAANRPPVVSDTTFGFWRRWLVVPFLSIYLPGEPGFVPKLAEFIIANEMPGVARWAVEGAIRLTERGMFVIPTAMREAVEEWRLYADQVAAFLSERTEPTAVQPDWTGADTLFRAYESWALEQRGRQVGKKNFARRLAELGVPFKRRVEGRFYGVRLTARSAPREAR